MASSLVWKAERRRPAVSYRRRCPNAVVVKQFNSDLAKGGAVPPGGGCNALPYAVDDTAACGLVAQLVKDAGFDAVFAGPIEES